MTKQDCLDELKEALDELLACQNDPFCRGQYIALDYARDLVKDIRPYVARKTSSSVYISLTKEQAGYLSSLLGNGPLDRVIRAKITRSVNDLWQD